MLAYFGEKISPHMTDTPEGYLICHDVPIGRVGEMEYLAGELRLTGDTERVVRVGREEEEVFAPAAMASFEGKPVTDGHPPEGVGPENFSAYAKGHVQNVRRSGDFLLADLHLMDPCLVSEVKNGVKREVSCGYTCRYAKQGGGYRQKMIRGNHVAVVPRGRAGHEVAIKDAAIAARKGLKHMKKETKLALLRAFGLAAQEAEPEELEQLTSDTAGMLDEAAQTERTADKAPDYSGLEAKLDRLLSAMDALSVETEEPEKPEEESPEEKLDKAADALGGAEVIEEEKAEGPVADAAKRILKSVRPAIAAMQDPKEKKRVTDALLESIRAESADTGAKLLGAAEGAAKRAADSSPEARFEAQRAAYNARNPHMKKEEQ